MTIARRVDALALVLAGMTLAGHLLGNPHYGFFRDELYFIMCGRHPALGYVDQPPVVPLAAASSQIVGTSLFALRAIPALLGAATVYTACRLARALGGDGFAVVITGIACALAPVLAAFSSQLAPDSVEMWLWPLITLFVVGALRDHGRWWLAAGAAAGAAGEAKYIVAFFAVALVAGIVLSSQRHALASGWFAGGAALALAIVLPNVLWQAHDGFPMLELLRNGQHGKNVVLSPVAFCLEQIEMVNAVLSLVWLAGLVWSARHAQWRWLGYAYWVLLASMIALNAKNYYPAAVYSCLFAAGGVALERWTSRRVALRPAFVMLALVAGAPLLPLVVPVLPEPRYIAYVGALSHVVPLPGPSEHHALAVLGQDFSDMHGWPELAETVVRVFDGLPPSERTKAAVFAGNYGEAAALDFFGAGRLPPALSGHNQYWLWGPRRFDGSVLIDVGATVADDLHVCRSARLAATFSSEYVMPFEDHLGIVVCRRLRLPVARFWAEQKHYD